MITHLELTLDRVDHHPIPIDVLDQTTPVAELTQARDAPPVQRGELACIPNNGGMTASGSFDYEQYDDAIANELRGVAANIRAHDRDSKAAIVDIGAALLRVKETVGHGNWGTWLHAEFEMSAASAERYMRVAERFPDKSSTVTNLQARTLYQLAAKSTPPEVADRIVADLESGTALSNEVIIDQIRQAKEAAMAAAQEAKLTPQDRKAKERRRLAAERRQEEWKRKNAEREAASRAASNAAAEILASCLGDRRKEFIALLDMASLREIKHRLGEVVRGAAIRAESSAVSVVRDTLDPENGDEPPLPFMNVVDQPLAPAPAN